MLQKQLDLIVEVECDFKQNGNPEMRCSTNALFETTTTLH